MAQHRFVLDKALRIKLGELHDKLTELGIEIEGMAGDVREEHDEHLAAYAETTEKFQESARGENVSTWIERIESIADSLDSLGEDMDALTGEIDELPEKPEA